MIISVVSAAIGLFVMIVAGLTGAGNITLAAIYVLSACPTLFLLFCAMLNVEVALENQGQPAGEDASSLQDSSVREVNPFVQLTIRGYRSDFAMDSEN